MWGRCERWELQPRQWFLHMLYQTHVHVLQKQNRPKMRKCSFWRRKSSDRINSQIFVLQLPSLRNTFRPLASRIFFSMRSGTSSEVLRAFDWGWEVTGTHERFASFGRLPRLTISSQRGLVGMHFDRRGLTEECLDDYELEKEWAFAET